MTPPERITVELGDRFRTQVWSAGAGPALVYLHGWWGLPEWPNLLARLATRFRVFAPELPGYGESTGIERLDDVLDFATYHFELFDALGLDRPHLVGHSTGGMIAAELAALSPPSVDRLVLVSSYGLWLDESPVPDLFAVTADDLPNVAVGPAHAGSAGAEGRPSGSAGTTVVAPSATDTETTATLEAARALLTPPDEPEAWRTFQVQRSKNLRVAAKLLWPIPDRGLSKRLHRVKAPTLVLWGSSDRLVPPVYASAFGERIAASRVDVLPGGGHLLPYEQPATLADRIMTFLG